MLLGSNSIGSRQKCGSPMGGVGCATLAFASSVPVPASSTRTPTDLRESRMLLPDWAALHISETLAPCSDEFADISAHIALFAWESYLTVRQIFPVSVPI